MLRSANKRARATSDGSLCTTAFTQASQPAISLIGAACSLGSPIPGSEQAPSHLQQLGLKKMLQEEGINALWHTIITARAQKSSLQAVAELCQQLANSVSSQVLHNHFFGVLGGDHSCAIGTWSGVYRARKGKPFGLIWVDAHMDSHTLQSSHTGALHGMPLACLLGQGASELTRLVQPGPALLPEHVCLIGVRSYEPEEAALLKNLGVRIYTMTEIEQRGMACVMAEALQIVKRAGDFGVSIDLDALDPQLAPAVSVPEPGGLQLTALLTLLQPLASTPGFLGIEITEFNPRLDLKDKTARLIGTILISSVPTPPQNSGAHHEQ